MCPRGGGYDTEGNDIDECRLFPNLCENGRCMNTVGSYRCVCTQGYKSDSATGQCVDIDECREGQASCDHVCQNMIGSFRCTCRQGYILNMDGKTCRDIDECATGQHNCPNECINTEGGFECGCPEGYRQDRNKQCVDIDECAEQAHLCTPGGQCRNTQGGYMCVCNRGYKLDSTGQKCIDIDECEDGQCENLCENSVGGFYCGCPEGFTEYWGQCVEIDVCNTSPCVYECVPAGQAFMCGCPPGYQMMGEGHCIQTISPADYSSMFPPGVELPHDTSLGAGELPPGEGCYSCNVGDTQLEVPLSKRNKRSVAGYGAQSIVSSEDLTEWRKDNDKDSDDETYEALLKKTGDVVIEDIRAHPHKFRPKLLKIVKREAIRQKGNQLRRHRSRKQRHIEDDSAAQNVKAVPVFLTRSDVTRKTKLIKILPALSALQGNVDYKITNRNDKLFFLKERKGINSLHARHKKLRAGMSYHVDIEALPIHEESEVNGHDMHLEKSIFSFFIYVL